MRRLIMLISVFSVVFVTGLISNAEESNAASQCGKFDVTCEEKSEECANWDTKCQNEADDCPLFSTSCGSNSGSSNTALRPKKDKVEYTEKVSCALVLEGIFGGVSGYCNHSPEADLDHCIPNVSRFTDNTTLDLLCAEDSQSLMAKYDSNEIRVDNLGPGYSFGDPYWLICDEGMGSVASNKRCYDSDYSDGDDWDAMCKVDRRIQAIIENGESYRWYVCT